MPFKTPKNAKTARRATARGERPVIGRYKGTLTAPGTCPFLNSSGGRTSRIRAPVLLLLLLLLLEEEEEVEEEEKMGSADRSEGSCCSGLLPRPPPLSRANTSSCGEMCLASLALRVLLISFHAFGDVGREPPMSRPDSPRGLSRAGEEEEEEEEEEEKARIVLCFLLVPRAATSTPPGLVAR